MKFDEPPQTRVLIFAGAYGLGYFINTTLNKRNLHLNLVFAIAKIKIDTKTLQKGNIHCDIKEAVPNSEM